MKYYILIIMMAAPGEFVEHHAFDKMPFDNVDDCTHFSQTYWKNLTSLAELKHRKEWGNMFCIPERSMNNELISNVLNKRGV